MLPTRITKVIAMLEREEEAVKMMAISRSHRLGRLLNLQAPDFIIAIELRMVMEAVEALFRHHEYDPFEDDRVMTKEVEGDSKTTGGR